LVVGDYTLNADEFENRLNIRDGVTGMPLPDNTAVVILDAELNSELIAEGLANDALRFIQDTRKALGLDVSDRINITYTADLALSGALEQHKKMIMSNALVREMSPGPAEHFTEIEGYNFGISIQKA
jgi:isoleucyl-tRNA synthetase